MKVRFPRWSAAVLLSACLLGGGCATASRTLELDAQHPAVRVAVNAVYFGDRRVMPQEVPEILEDYDIPHDRVIHIRLDPDVKDLRVSGFLMACLAKAGYTRPVLVTSRHAESVTVGRPGAKGAQRKAR